MNWTTVETRLGRFVLVAHEGAIVRIALPGSDLPLVTETTPDERDARVLAEASHQVRAYAEGRTTDLDFPVRPEGTPFQLAVWGALRGIPPGETRSYADIAAAIGRPGAARAVGQANRANPLPLIVPCHRVVAADGGLGGFMGADRGEGLALKQKMLDLERA